MHASRRWCLDVGSRGTEPLTDSVFGAVVVVLIVVRPVADVDQSISCLEPLTTCHLLGLGCCGQFLPS